MDVFEMHIGFKLEADKTSNLENPSFELEEIDFWLNSATRKFTKTRYSGLNVKKESFEQTQKRINDLRTLIRQEVLSCVKSELRRNAYEAYLTELVEGTYWFTVGEEVLIAYLGLTDTAAVVGKTSLIVDNTYYVINDSIVHEGETYNVGDYFKAESTSYTGDGSVVKLSNSIHGVTEITSDTYRAHMDNPYSEHRLHYEEAKPLRLYTDFIVELITDGSYGVLEYHIRYLAAPREISYELGENCDLPEHTHDEIVKLAVSMALENIEQPRYQSHMNELITME